jgi:hypothetical protein
MSDPCAPNTIDRGLVGQDTTKIYVNSPGQGRVVPFKFDTRQGLSATSPAHLRDYQQTAVERVLANWPEFDRLLERNSVDLSMVQNRGHASVIINSLFNYLEREPATDKQKRYCAYLGHPNPWQLTKREAGRWIEQRKAQLQDSQC